MLFEEVNKSGTFTRKKWDELSNVQKGAVIAGGALLTLILVRGVQSVAGRGNVQKVPVNPNLLNYQTTTGQLMQWNPDPLAKEISTNFEGVNFFDYPETTDKIKNLQDEQLKALYNYYNEYYAQDEPTLTKLIENEVSYFQQQSYREAVARLKSLGLN